MAESESSEATGIIFDIERCAVNDGPGIRTVVFLKGCALRCKWCANPESQRKTRQIGFIAQKCVGCGACVTVCPHGAVFAQNGAPDFICCDGCLSCVDVCMLCARKAYGRRASVTEVVAVIEKDAIFYNTSGGGVTLSGGEACLQPGFARGILRLCKSKGIHTAIETSGFVPTDDFLSVVEQAELVLFDIKTMDDEKHIWYTGASNSIILINLVAAAKVVPAMTIRIPVIPGVNDGDGDMLEVAGFLSRNAPGVTKIDLLPYHSVGASKSAQIGREYLFVPPYELTRDILEHAKNLLEDAGFYVSIGG